MRLIISTVTHAIALAIGFALGIYLLPILTAPDSPDAAMLEKMAADALYTAELTRELRGSDFLHWGEGTISVTPTQIGASGPRPMPTMAIHCSAAFGLVIWINSP